MSKIHNLLVLSLAMLPFSAMGETYKCRSPDGKISYAGQMSLTPGVKCEQMFVKKQSVVVQEAQPATSPETGEPAEMNPENPPPNTPNTNAVQPTSPDSKKLDSKSKKVEADTAKKKIEKAAPEKSAADKQAEQKLKEENCQSAKVNLRTYQAGGRISKVNESGEKIPMDDAEIQQKTQEAQMAVDKWCGS